MTHVYLDPTTTTQVQLERVMLDFGKDKFMDQWTKERERNQLGNSAPIAKTIDDLYPVVAGNIVTWKELIETEGRGRYPHAYGAIKDIEPALLAYIGLRVILDLIMSRNGCTEHRAALQIGQWVEHEHRVHFFSQTHGKYLARVQQLMNQRSQNAGYRKTVLTHVMRKKGEKWRDWSHNERVGIGFVIIEAILGAGDFIVQEQDWNSETKLTVTQRFVDMVHQTAEGMANSAATVLPCIEKPKPWTSPTNGGFHNPDLRKEYPILTAHHKKDRMRMLSMANMPQVYRAINAVQDTAWKINTKVLDVMTYLWNSRLDLGVLPDIEELPLPARPANIDTDPDVLRKWKHEASNVYQMRVRQRSRRLNLKRAIDVATDYKDREFYFVHQCDFRGRLYAQGAGPNPQGTDYQKALLVFAKGKPIGDEGGPSWLYIHAANSYGVDKVSLKDRIDWTIDNLDMIARVAADPIEHRDWTKADNPWAFLAACFEVAGYMEYGSQFITRLPITVDGTCNGLQHYSAMLRDAVGGEATNLIPAEKPQDIYGRVAQVVVAKDPTLKGIVTRSVAKRPVMVLPYGGTFESCKKYVKAALREAGHTFEEERETEIAMLVWNSIGDVVVAAKEGMAFLRQVSSAMSKKKEHVSWTTPSGWPVLQQYFNMKKKQFPIRSFGKRVDYVAYTPDMDVVDGRRSGQGLPPNFVHSLDAAALVGMVDLALDNGIGQFAVVHDSFGTLAPDMDMLGGCIRTSFVNMYQNHDVLQELRDQVVAVIGETKTLPNVPAKGQLDISGVLESPFFFA